MRSNLQAHAGTTYNRYLTGCIDVYAIEILLGKDIEKCGMFGSLNSASETIFECEIYTVSIGGVAKYHNSKHTVARGDSGNFVPRLLPVLELTPHGRACLY